jgi:hypothetical protein
LAVVVVVVAAVAARTMTVRPLSCLLHGWVAQHALSCLWVAGTGGEEDEDDEQHEDDEDDADGAGHDNDDEVHDDDDDGLEDGASAPAEHQTAPPALPLHTTPHAHPGTCTRDGQHLAMPARPYPPSPPFPQMMPRARAASRSQTCRRSP